MKCFERFKRLSLVVASLFWAGMAWSAPPNSPWNGSYFPNIKLVTQDGKTVRFYDDLIRGKVVAINFFFTHCKAMCSAETANLRRVVEQLGDRVGRDVHFYSISIDPKWDTPAALKQYAKRFGVGSNWTFLTGSKQDVTLLRKKLGLFRDEKQEALLANHTTSFMIGNEETGQWVKRSAFDHPEVLARMLGNSLQTSPATRPGLVSYGTAQVIPNMSKGEELFRTRCLLCHSLGKEEGTGPGLAGVTSRRDPTWLARWIKEPDVMLDEKDPIATSLFAKYNQVQMPNMSLSDADVAALVSFLKEKAPDR